MGPLVKQADKQESLSDAESFNTTGYFYNNNNNNDVIYMIINNNKLYLCNPFYTRKTAQIVLKPGSDMHQSLCMTTE